MEHRISKETVVCRKIEGDVRVNSGVRFHLVGMVDGDLYVEPGAECQVDGIVLGDVENAGHTVIRGTVVGSLVDVDDGYTMSTPTHPSPASIPRDIAHTTKPTWARLYLLQSPPSRFRLTPF